MKYQLGLPILVLVFSGCMKIKPKSDETPAAAESVKELSLPTEKIETLSGEINLKDDKEINADRIILKSNLKLYMRYNSIKMNAKIIEFEYGAMISNFKDSDVAEVERKGFDGGHLYIKSETASGSLMLVLNGQKGGYGRNGFDREVPNNIGTLTRVCWPNNGADSGNSGSAYLDIGVLNNIKIYKEMKITAGGDRGAFSIWPNYNSAHIAKVSLDDNCNSDYQSVRDGRPGNPGLICVINDIDTASDCLKFKM